MSDYSEQVWILNQMLTSSPIEEFGRDVVIFKKIQYTFVIDMPFSDFLGVLFKRLVPLATNKYIVDILLISNQL